MLYLAYSENKQYKAALFDTKQKLNLFMSVPTRTEYAICNIGACGKTYSERKEDLSENAKYFQTIDGEISGGDLSWGEYMMIISRFETLAKRYGLVNEFKENGII